MIDWWIQYLIDKSFNNWFNNWVLFAYFQLLIIKKTMRKPICTLTLIVTKLSNFMWKQKFDSFFDELFWVFEKNIYKQFAL